MKQLKFAHITKTGGTSIEKIAKKNKINWGMYDKYLKIVHIHWHYPLRMLPKKLIKHFDWFIVCRNPYERIISEYHCYWGGNVEQLKNVKYDENSKREFNIYVRNAIKNRAKSKYYGHYLEQHLYYIKNINIIRFENLKEDFENLMKKYNLDLKLDLHEYKTTKIFSIRDFDEETIKLINTVYDKDFTLFNYQKINL